MNWLRRLTARYASVRRLPRLLRKKRVPILIAWAVLVFGITQTSWFAKYQTFQEMEQERINWRFRWRGPVPERPEIVIVGITDSSIDTGLLAPLAGESEALALMAAQRFPWHRKVWAVLIEKLMQAGAKVVALDLILDGDFPGNDELAAVIAKYRDRLVLGSRFDTGEAGGTKLSYTPPATVLLGEADPESLVGSCLFKSEIDGTVRRFDYRTSMLREYGMDDDSDDIVSFAPLAVAKFLGKEAPHGYRQLVPFQGPAGTYRHFPMEEILGGSHFLRGGRYEGGAIFQDKLVFVGPIAEILHDRLRTPYGETAGVEIHAQLAGALLSGRMLRDAPAGSEFWFTLGLAATTATLLIHFRQALAQAAVIAVLSGALALAMQLFFTRALMVIPIVAPGFALLWIGVFGVIFTFAIEQLEKARIRGVLDRYVSKNVANIIVERADEFEEMMRGEKRNVSILFSDVRGFTGIFEVSDPVALVDQLNEYFAHMVTLIHREGGTLQKFIGDAILAAWGDTHSLGLEEDAIRAVRTALAMRPALQQLNEHWIGDPKRIEMRIGIGVNHGEVVVGEIGSIERKEFTVIGDAVNTAARFETATKQYGVDILIGGSVEQLTIDKFVYRRVDLARFMGKKHPVEVFTVLSDHSVPVPAWLPRYHAAVADFRAARFDQAAVLFRQVNAELGDRDFLCEMYLARIAEYAKTPPPPHWDGAYTLKEK